MTFRDLCQSVYADTGYKSEPKADVVTRVKRWINEGHKHCLRMAGMEELRRATLTFASVASQKIYGFPQAFERIDAILDEANNRRLGFLSRDAYRLVDPGETATGGPSQYWTPEGWQPAFFQPTSDGVWVVSTSVLDITQKVKFQGIRANGDLQAAQEATLNGTARVAIGTITDYVQITMWMMDSAAVGTVSLYDASASGNELSRLPINATSVQYQTVRLWPTPSAAITYTVDGILEVGDLVQNNDTPILPPIFHDLPAAYARMREYERTNDPRLPIAAAEFERGAQTMRSQIAFPADYRPVAGSLGNAIGWNNLGGNYPADRSWP